MSRLRRALTIATAAIVFPPTLLEAQDAPVAVTLVSAGSDLRADGPLQVQVRFSIQPGWHIYAPDPGDAGLPTTVAVTVPRGYVVGPVRWPEPRRFVYGSVVSYGYAGEVVLPIEVRHSSGRAIRRRVPIRADVRWAACAEVCIPGRAVLELVLAPAAGDVQ